MMNLGRAVSWSLMAGAVLGFAVTGGCSSSDFPPEGGTADAEAGGTTEDGSGQPESGDGAPDVSVTDAANDGSDAADVTQEGDAADAADATDATDGAEASDAALGCDACGSPRFAGECASAEAACLADSGCSAIRSCVFEGGDAKAACTLGPNGAVCVTACVQANCADAGSSTLYRALEQCVYCSACATACSSYCNAVADSGTTTCTP